MAMACVGTFGSLWLLQPVKTVYGGNTHAYAVKKGAQCTTVQEIAYSTQRKNYQPLLQFQDSHLHQSMVLSHTGVSTEPAS